VDEVDLSRDTGHSDGASALVLTTLPAEGSVRVVGCAVARTLEDAIELACRKAGLSTPPEVLKVHRDAIASGSLMSCAAAVQSLRLAPGTTLVADSSLAASCAMILQRSDA
jgi:hypothetical protein